MNSLCNDRLSVGLTEEQAESLGTDHYDALYDIVSEKFQMIGIEIDSTKPIELKKVNGEYRAFAHQLFLEEKTCTGINSQQSQQL